MSTKGQEKSGATQSTQKSKLLAYNQGTGCDNFTGWKEGVRSALLKDYPAEAQTFVDGGKYGVITSAAAQFRMANEDEMKLDSAKRPVTDRSDGKKIYYDPLEYEAAKSKHLTKANEEAKLEFRVATNKSAIFERIYASLSTSAATKISDQPNWSARKISFDVDWLWKTIHKEFQTAQTGLPAADGWNALREFVNCRQKPHQTLHQFKEEFDEKYKVLMSLGTTAEPAPLICESWTAAGLVDGLGKQFTTLKVSTANMSITGAATYPDTRTKAMEIANAWRMQNPQSGPSQTTTVAGMTFVTEEVTDLDTGGLDKPNGNPRGGKRGRGGNGGGKRGKGGNNDKKGKDGGGGEGGDKGKGKGKGNDGPISWGKGKKISCWSCNGNHRAADCPELEKDANEAMGTTTKAPGTKIKASGSTTKATNMVITAKGSALMEGRFPPNAVLLDNQAGKNAEICGNPDLLSNVRPLDIDLHIQGIGKDVVKPTLQGDTTHFGSMTLYPELGFTILSASKRQAAGQRIKFVNRMGNRPGKFILYVNSKEHMEFEEDEDGHYVWFAPNVEPTNRVLAAAADSDDDVHALGFPSMQDPVDSNQDLVLATMSTTRQEREREFSGAQVAAARRGQSLRDKFGGFSDAVLKTLANKDITNPHGITLCNNKACFFAIMIQSCECRFRFFTVYFVSIIRYCHIPVLYIIRTRLYLGHG